MNLLQKAKKMKKYTTPSFVAKYLGITKQAIYYHIDEGNLDIETVLDKIAIVINDKYRLFVENYRIKSGNRFLTIKGSGK